MTETTPTDSVRVVRDGECKLDNHLVDTSIANLGADDTDQYQVVQSSVSVETQPAPIFFESLAVLPQPTPAFLHKVDLDYMRKSWSSLAVVSALTPSPDDSVFDKIPGSERRPPYFTDEGEGGIHAAKRLHVQDFYSCKQHEKRKSRYAYEELAIYREVYETLDFDSDDTVLTAGFVQQQVDDVFAHMTDECMHEYSINQLHT